MPAATPAGAPTKGGSVAATTSFIETQLPVSRLSKESYKERKANISQTLTGLGKWWGRKPLVLVRAIILGLLMPASNDPRRDRDVFLALMTMDGEGLWRRKQRNIPLREVYRLLSAGERDQWFDQISTPDRPRLKQSSRTAARALLERLVFDRMSYDEKLRLCGRPEHLKGPSPDAWRMINGHMGTTADSLPALVKELGERRFGRVPCIGDAFCGGGSVPFESARLGCEAYAADLNPVAALLTWGALHIVGGHNVAEEVRQAQKTVFSAVDRQVTEWGIEHNEAGWRAEAFLYCVETICPECGWLVPLAPSWVIGRKTRTTAQLVSEPARKCFAIEIRSDVDRDSLKVAGDAGTVRNSRLECPNPACRTSTPIAAIRGDRRSSSTHGNKLRRWENDDIAPRAQDVFQERLYCVRWRLPPLDALLWAEQRRRAKFPLVADVAAVPQSIRSQVAFEFDSPQADIACSNSRAGGEQLSGATHNAEDSTTVHLDDPSPVPAWVNQQRAITALIELLGADEQREVEELRARNWLAEDAAAQDSKGMRKLVARRNGRIEELAKSLPSVMYRSPGAADLAREARSLALLKERFAGWQARGCLPSRMIVPGQETERLIRERGWTHWHHLFTPRQLLVHGLFAEVAAASRLSKASRASCLLGLGRLADWDSRLSRWWTDSEHEKIVQTFSNQAFNTLFTFGSRSVLKLADSWYLRRNEIQLSGLSSVQTKDARTVDERADIWITDPPYADAINYHELSEFFLAWYEKTLPDLFPDGHTDSRRALAVQATGERFYKSMVESYRNLAALMPADGVQVAMFTHQDAAIWADLTLILWAAGLRVVTAWTIATETPFGIKEGNYVQGTVLMVLRRQTSDETAFLDELVPEVEGEVERQLESMLALDDQDDPNFADTDYQLAAYAAALRVLTRYRSIEDLDISHELSRDRGRDTSDPITRIIADAVRTASNLLVPRSLPAYIWRRLSPSEKFYVKGIDIERHGDFRAGVYQEFARGFGVQDYGHLLHTGNANQTRLKTATEFGRGDQDGSLVRHALYAVWRAVETGDVRESIVWLRTELSEYWSRREDLTVLLRYLAAIDVDHWREDAAAALRVAGAVENDHV